MLSEQRRGWVLVISPWDSNCAPPSYTLCTEAIASGHCATQGLRGRGLRRRRRKITVLGNSLFGQTVVGLWSQHDDLAYILDQRVIVGLVLLAEATLNR